MNNKGEIAVGACSGGWMAKSRGEFSNTCAIGGGIYADDNIGGLSLAGDGKYMLRMMLALQIARDMEMGRLPLKASKDWLRTLWCKFGEEGGAVGVSKYGDIGVAFTTTRMPWAYQARNILHFGIEKQDDFKEIVC